MNLHMPTVAGVRDERTNLCSLARAAIGIAAGAGALGALAGLLYTAWCWFTHFEFEFDYGIYTNMLWNTAHGRPFVCIHSGSYLGKHLAFSLAPLGFAYRIWDHPFLASVLQWLALAGGAATFLAMARRSRLPWDHTAAFLFFFVAHPYVQSTLLHEIHTVGFYFLLCPLLCYCLMFRKSLAWIPVLAILGLREEAGFYIVPLLLYQAVKDRWIGGYVLAVLAVGYSAMACAVLYPWINDTALAQRRDLGAAYLWKRVMEVPLWLRLKPLLWVGLFVLPVLKTGWRPAVVFLAVALPLTTFSPLRNQYLMTWHYGAPVVALLACAVFYGLADAARAARGSPWRDAAVSFLLVAFTIIAHVQAGYLPEGGRQVKDARRTGLHGLLALAEAHRIPPEGSLMTSRRLTPFVANRADLLVWSQLQRHGDEVKRVFFRGDGVTPDKPPREVVQWLREGTFGVVWWDGCFGLLERGYDVRGNAEVVAALVQPRSLLFADCMGNDSQVRLDDRKPGLVRYWSGKVRQTPPIIAYGCGVLLPQGRYVARFIFRAGKAPDARPHGLGQLCVLHEEGERLIASEPIAAAPPLTPVAQPVVFSVETECLVTPRVIGGDVELWLERVVFEPQ